VTSNIADNTISVFGIADMGGPSVFHVGRQPEGIAIAPDGNTAWVGSNRDSLVLVVDTHSGAALDTIRGLGLPYRMAVSADGKRAVVTDPVNANVRVFDVASRKQRFSIPISRDSLVDKPEVSGSPSPEGLVLSPDSRWAFVTLQGRNRVATIDLDTGTIVGLAPTGNWSDGIAYSRLTHPR
jgi:DNA-binding beta-propeller fold protein YncE